jgi:hypothetical protein
MADNTQEETTVSNEQDPAAVSSDASAADESTREENADTLIALCCAALQLAAEAGINVDASSVGFDLSADNGDVVVSVVDADGQTDSKTMAAADIEPLMEEMLADDESEDAQEDEQDSELSDVQE